MQIRIKDVLDYEEWEAAVAAAYIDGPTLQQVCMKALDDLLKLPSCKRLRAGDVVYFVSRDKQRAKYITCLDSDRKLYSVSAIAFGKYSPELVISEWIASQLADAGMPVEAEELRALSVEDRIAKFRELGAGRNGKK